MSAHREQVPIVPPPPVAQGGRSRDLQAEQRIFFGPTGSRQITTYPKARKRQNDAPVGVGNIPKKQKEDYDVEELDGDSIPLATSPPVPREDHPVDEYINDPDDIYASQEAAEPNLPTSVGSQQLHGCDAVPPHDRTLESLDGDPQGSSQSYPDVEGYGEMDAEGWKEVERVCAANERDLTLLRSFDPRARVVNWSSGHKTFLPWLSFDDIGVKNERAQDEAQVTTLAQLPLLDESNTPAFSKMAYRDKSAVSFAADISSHHLAFGYHVLIRPPAYATIRWNLEDFQDILGLHSAGFVRVEDHLGQHNQRTVQEFMQGYQRRCWAVVDHPVQDTGMPRVTNHLDHGYNLGWRSQIPGEEPIAIPNAVERQHSWVSLLPPTYLKRANSGNPLQGQAALFQVRQGSLFVAFSNVPMAHLSETRVELYIRNAEESPEWNLVYLQAGDIFILPPGARYSLYSPDTSIVTGRYFYNLSCLHITEATRTASKFSKHCMHPDTEPDIIAAWETLTRLLATIPFVDIQPMERKPLLALMAMCRNPYAYVGHVLEIETKSYLKKVDAAIREYLHPAAVSKGKVPASMEAFVERNKKKTKKPKGKDSEAAYELDHYHTMALNISKDILEHVDRKRYSYPVMTSKKEQIELVKWENDYLFAKDIAQFWKSPGKPLTETEWKEVFGNRR